jgi:hypothetical protein
MAGIRHARGSAFPRQQRQHGHERDGHHDEIRQWPQAQQIHVDQQQHEDAEGNARQVALRRRRSPAIPTATGRGG